MNSALRTPHSALYLHIPFCVRRCHYCDFYVVPLGDGPPGKRMREFRSLKHRRFLQALDAELAGLPEGFQPSTVYIGGGTPTELPPEDLGRVFDSLERHVDLSRVTEFSCEANPGTLDMEMAELLISRGVTRISLGVQSFVDRTLESLGRIHNAEEAGDAVRLLRGAGCRNLSIDLLFALPGTQSGDLARNLQALRDLHPDHVSWYSLEFEPGTMFTDLRDKGFLHEQTDEDIAKDYKGIRTGLADLGYNQYELFSFSHSEKECQHNINYWRGGDYFGCGPSAHSHRQGVRWQNASDLAAYLGNEDHHHSKETLSSDTRARELLMTSLRLTNGVEEDWFHQHAGCRFEDLLGKELKTWERAGWIRYRKGLLQLTPEAYLVSDQLFRELF